jgi:hypothetical protein
METFAHERQWLNQGDMVIVECDQKCNIRIADDQNFEKFRGGQEHRYYGGFYRILPARIVIPKSGYWNVIIDLGGRRATAKYRIRYEKADARATA